MCHESGFWLAEDPVMSDGISDDAPDVMLVQGNQGGELCEADCSIEWNKLG